jgi:hypothetical protein
MTAFPRVVLSKQIASLLCSRKWDDLNLEISLDDLLFPYFVVNKPPIKYIDLYSMK